MEARFIWEYDPQPTMRIPAIGGASLTISTAVSTEAMSRGLGAVGVDIELMTPTYRAVHGRRPVTEDFAERLGDFLWSVASEFNPEDTVDTFEDSEANLTIQVIDSTNFTVTLSVEVVADDSNGTDDIDGLSFETSRAVLITAAEEARRLTRTAEWAEGVSITEPDLPIGLFFDPRGHRLTGLYRTGRGVGGGADVVAVFHFLDLADEAHGEVETSLLVAHLPFCSVAAHGVDDRRRPWIIVSQIVPVGARSTLGKPWNAVQVARDELHRAIRQMADVTISGESVNTHTDLLDLIEAKGVDRQLIEDWTVEDLALAGVAELANVPLPQLAVGRLTGCAFPDVDHNCPKDVFDCAFTRWQERLFNEEVEDN
jgi:hypothetical protein